MTEPSWFGAFHSSPTTQQGDPMFQAIKLDSLVNSLIYSLIGVAIFWISFLIIDKLTPYHLWKEIVEDKNVALAIVVGGMAIGICVIIAAAIH
jgi:putative membrane protein